MSDHEPDDVVDAPPAGKWRIAGWVIIGLVFAVGCWIRFKIATGELLWLDELHTGWVVDGSFQQMLTRSAQGNQAPAFFALTWSLIQSLGKSEFTLRLVSLLAGALAMGLAGRFVWLQTRSIAAAALTLTLIAVDYSFIRYATEARPYVLLHLFSIIQAGCFWRSLECWRRSASDPTPTTANHRFDSLWLLLSSWLLIYTHYTGVFLLVAEFLFLFPMLIGPWLSQRLASGTIKQIFITLILFLVGCVPILFQINQAFGKPADWSLITSLEQFCNEQKVNGLYWFGVPLLAVLFSVGVIALFKRQTIPSTLSDRWQHARWLCWIAAWFALPLLTMVVMHQWADIPIALSRYFSVALIAGPIFAGAIVGTVSTQVRWIAIPIIIVASVFVHVQNNSLITEIAKTGQLPLLRFENWQAAIAAVNARSDKANQPLFLFGAVIEDANALSDTDTEFQAYLQFPVRSLYGLDSTERVVFAGPTIQYQHFDDRYLDTVVQQGGAWILVRHRPEITIEIASQLVNLLREHLGDPDTMVETNWFGNRENVVHLISIEIKK